MTTSKARKPATDHIEYPDFDVLLQFSLWLSKNGRSAAWSLQDIMTESNQRCHEWMPKSGRENWLRDASASHKTAAPKIVRDPGDLTKTDFDSGYQAKDDDKSIAADETAATPQQSPAISPESANRAKAIASLPSVFRSAMILSDLEGFSYREIADLAGVTPKLVAKLLIHGRKMLLNGLQVGFAGKSAGSNA